MKILVTGATGFLGGHLVSALAAQGHSVRALSRGSGMANQLRNTHVEIVRGDLKDLGSMRAAIDGIDTVCHAAAAMQGPWQEHFETTVQGTERLLKLSQSAGVKRFVHISSITVYRTWDRGKNLCIDETSPCDPDPEQLGPYAHAKIEAEKKAFRYMKQGLPVVVLRPGIIYGPGGRMVHPNVGYFLTKKLFLRVGRGDNLLPFTYVDNTVDGILLALSSQKAVGQIYNLVDGEAITQKEFLECYRKSVNSRFVSLSFPLPLLLFGAALARYLKWVGLTSIVTTARGFKAQYANVHFDSSKARRELEWLPRIALEEGLQRTFSGSDLGAVRADRI